MPVVPVPSESMESKEVRVHWDCLAIQATAAVKVCEEIVDATAQQVSAASVA